MDKVLKYTLNIADITVLDIPQSATILSAIAQNDNIVVYVLADGLFGEVTRKVTFRVAGTDHSISSHYVSGKFVGTVKLREDLIFHVFCIEGGGRENHGD